MSAFNRARTLPEEIVLIIACFVALPEVSSRSRGNIYADALSICQVSKAFRRVALRAVLHTVILPRMKQISEFIAALHLQQGHLSAGSPLYVDYTQHVRKMCIGEYAEPPPPAPTWSIRTFDLGDPVSTHDDISVLTPVLLGADALGIDGQSLALLCHCLQRAWQSVSEEYVELDVPVENLPWRRSAFTVFGDVPSWKPLQSTPEGLKFLASLSSITLLPSGYSFHGDCGVRYSALTPGRGLGTGMPQRMLDAGQTLSCQKLEAMMEYCTAANIVEHCQFCSNKI